MSHAVCLPALVLVFALASVVRHAVSRRMISHDHLGLFLRLIPKAAFVVNVDDCQ